MEDPRADLNYSSFSIGFNDARRSGNTDAMVVEPTHDEIE